MALAFGRLPSTWGKYIVTGSEKTTIDGFRWYAVLNSDHVIAVSGAIRNDNLQRYSLHVSFLYAFRRLLEKGYDMRLTVIGGGLRNAKAAIRDRFCWDVSAGKTLALYNKAIGRKRARASETSSDS